jgi:hypothetical protein
LTIRLATNRIDVIRHGPNMRSATEREDLENEDLENVVTRNDLDPLILDLLEWIARERRSYADVIEAWRTSCPRLTVWEDAVDRGFAVREHSQGRDVLIRLTVDGRDFLREHGRSIGEIATAPDAVGSRAAFYAAGVATPRPNRCAA